MCDILFYVTSQPLFPFTSSSLLPILIEFFLPCPVFSPKGINGIFHEVINGVKLSFSNSEGCGVLYLRGRE